MTRRAPTRSVVSSRAVVAVVAAFVVTAGSARPALAQDGVLGREEIRLLGVGLRVAPARQTVPKDIATIVSTYLQAPTTPDSPLPPFAPDAVVKAVLRGPGFAQPIEITTRPNTPFTLPPFSAAGLYSLDSIRLESGGDVLLHASPESVEIEVIEKLLVTQVTARPLTAAEIREKGIVFDQSSFQAYNFTATFAVGASTPVPLTFNVVLPTPDSPADITLNAIELGAAGALTLPRLETIIPDTLKLQTQIPNLRVVGFTLSVPALVNRELVVPPIPGVVVIPGDIGFLNQFFNVTLLVGNVAPPGSNLVVDELRAEILLPAGRDQVAGSADDPLRMARTEAGETARVQIVVQPGADGRIGSADDIHTLAPGETGRAEYLVEGRREGTHVIEMQMSGTLMGLPVGPVTVTGRAAGSVLVRNPTFTLTFTHPELINAGEPYTLDVTVTNTSESPANFVSVNLYAQNVQGATVAGAASADIESIAPGDSATVSFDLIAQLTGPIYAAALDSDENVNGRFALKTSVGELGVPLSPDSLILPKETRSLPADLRAAALGLLGKAWAVATSPLAALPAGVTRFSKQIVYDRAIELAEGGLRYTIGEPLADVAVHLAFDYAGSGFARIPEATAAPDERAFREADARGFDELRRTSIRGDRWATVIGGLLADEVRSRGALDAHQHLAEQTTWRPAHVSVLVTGDGATPSPMTLTLIDPAGRQVGGRDASGKALKAIPFGDLLPLMSAPDVAVGDLALLTVPDPGEYVVRLTRASGVAARPYTVSVVLPDGAGGLRQLAFTGLPVDVVPATIESPGGAFRIRFELAGAAATAAAARDLAIVDPPPRLIAVRQMVDADLLCGYVPAGRVVAVLFSEEVTPASVQDGLDRSQITHYAAEANEVIGVALQPGRRIAYLALRDPFGPYVPRSMTVSGVMDRRGQTMASTTMPMIATIARRGAVLSGRVLNADGTPAAGADARTFVSVSCGLIGLSEKLTAADGSFSWDYVPGDPGQVVANRVVGFDPRTGDGRGVNFQVQRDGQRIDVNVVFLGRGSITGRTFDEERRPLPRTSVRVTSLTDHSQHGATSDQEGRFSVSGVPVGNVIVEAVYIERDPATGHQLDAATVTESEFIPIAGAVMVRDLFLQRDSRRPPTVHFGKARGTVLRGDGVTPVTDVPVIAYYANGSQLDVNCPESGEVAARAECPLATGRTDANGRFAFEKLPAGQYRFETFDQLTFQQGEGRVVVPVDGEASLTVLLGLGLGTVRGVVLDAQGQPVAGARVGGGLSISVTDGSGQFVLEDVPVGRREIVAVDDASNTRATGLVDLLRAGDETNVVLVLPAVAGVAGTVTTFAGAPVANNRVFLIDCGGNCAGQLTVIAETVTNAAGQYSFSGVRLGRYRVSAFTPTFSDGNVTDIVLSFANQVVRGDVRFRGGATGRVRGRVLRALENGGGDTPVRAAVGVSSDLPLIAGGRVGVGFARAGNHLISESSLETGEFSMAGIWPGPFTLNAVSVFSPEPLSFESRIEQPNQTVTLDVRLQATSRVSGRVLLPDGVTPAGANVQVRLTATPVAVACGEMPNGEAECVTTPQPGVGDIPAVTDAAGRFEIVNVPARRFVLRAVDPVSGRSAEVMGDVRPGDTAEIDLRLRAQPVVRIVVRGFSGDAIPNALVEIAQRRGFGLESDDDLDVRLTADASGVLMVSGASAPVEGEFVVRATDRDGGGFSGRATGRIRAEDDLKTVTLEVFLFNAAGTVVGTVFRADGLTPVANAEVTLSNDFGALAFAVADANGEYRVESVPLGALTIDAFEAATARRGHATGSIDIAGREIVVNVTQYGIGLVRGTVLERASLAPVRGARVTLDTVLPSGRATGALVSTSDPDGRFFFPGVAEGAFVVRARATIDGPVGPIAADTAVDGDLERDGQIVELPLLVSLARPQFGRVEGTVFDAAGGPSPFAAVTLTGAQTPAGGTLQTTADAAGRFAFEGVPIGRVQLSATPQVGGFERATGLAELAFEGETARSNLVLRGTSTITGTVFEADGLTPAAFVDLFLEGQPTSGCEATTFNCPLTESGAPDPVCTARVSRGGCLGAADGTGRFSFTGFTGLTFTVTADGPVTGQRAQVGGPINPGQALDVRLVLSPVGRLIGRVVTAARLSRSGVVAHLTIPQPGASPKQLFVGSGPDGRFAFDGVDPGGPYTLRFSDPLGAGVALRIVHSAPGTVDLGDVVLDESPPAITAVAPPSGSLGVARDVTIRITFSEPINPATVTPANIVLAGPTANVAGVFTVEPGDASVLFRPLAALAENTRYTVAVRGVADALGKVMVPAATTFTTVDLTGPAVLELTPAMGASGVPTRSTVRVQFNEPIDPARFEAPPIVVSRGAEVLPGDTAYLFGNTVIVFTPRVPLADDTVYALRIEGAVDLAGNQAPPIAGTFSTTDRTPPQITSLSAANGGRVIEGQVVDVTAVAAAAFDVAYVDFHVGGVLTFTDRLAPFVFPLLAAPATAGPGQRIVVSAVATDTSGNRGVVPVSTTVEVIADEPPAVAFLDLADGVEAPNGARITFTVTASDDVGLTEVAYRADTGRAQDAAAIVLAPPASSREQTFAFNIPAAAAAGSVIPVSATVRDTKGRTVSSTVGVRVLDAVPPVVSITGTASGARVLPGSRVHVIVAATDPGGIATVTFRATGAATANESRPLNPAQIDVATAFAVDIPLGAQPGQTVTLEATAVDGSGNAATAATVPLTIADQNPPTLTLRTSTGRLEAVPGAELTIIAEAEDQVGVSRIDVRGAGAFGFSRTESFSPALGSAVATVTVTVPVATPPGAVLAVTGHATDLFGNAGDPIAMRLTVRAISDVAVPPVVLSAGETVDVLVTLSAPAPAGGTLLTLQSRAPLVARPAPTLTIPAGQTSALLSVEGLTGGTTEIDVLIQGVPRASFVATVRGGIVRGLVRGPNGPAAGVNVSVTRLLGGPAVSTTTDAQGRYALEGLYDPKGVRVRAADPATGLIGYGFAPFTLPNGSTTIDIDLVEAGRIDGTVTLADGETPVGAGARVDLFAARNTLQSLAFTFTADDGTYEFPLVLLDNYVIEASDTAGNRGRSTVAIDQSGEDATVDVRWLGRGRAIGRVLSAGAPVPNVPVTLRGDSIFGSSASVTVNAAPDGSFAFDGVFVGSFTLQAIDAGTGVAGSASGAIARDAQVVTRDVTLSPWTHVEGTVFRADGQTPVPGARVTVSMLQGTFVTTAGLDGRYELRYLPLGTFTLVAEDVAGTGSVNQVTGVFSLPSGTVARDISLLPLGTLVVTVQDGTGALVSGAAVNVTMRNGSLVRSRFATTAEDGVAVIQNLFVGAYQAAAQHGVLHAASVSGTLSADEVEPVTLQLHGVGSIEGTVFEFDGVTPVTDGYVEFNSVRQIYPTELTPRLDASGRFRFDGLIAGGVPPYRVAFYDPSGRLRGFSAPVVLDVAGEVRTANIVAIGAGSVSGQVVDQTAQPLGNQLVTVQALDPQFGNLYTAVTNANGQYVAEGVVAGPVLVTVVNLERQLAGEAAGTMPAAGGALVLNVATAPNAIALPTAGAIVARADANAMLYQVRRSGEVTSPSAGHWPFNPFAGASALDLTIDGATTRFEGATFVTQEDAGRELAAQQSIGGLAVTRKVAVPKAYFARHLELLTNTTGAPITVAVDVTSALVGLQPGLTSSGDQVLDVAGPAPDRWGILRTTTVDGDAFSATAPGAWAVAFNVNGPDTATPARTFVSNAVDRTVAYGWTLTIDPGQTVALMHFTAPQYSPAAAVASAGRLDQLPPEALAGLSAAEVAAVRNWVMPAGGVSSVDPLPPLGGTVTGRVYEFDGVTPSPIAPPLAGGGFTPRTVRFKSDVIYFGRVYEFEPDVTSTFTIATALPDTPFARAVPLAPFTVQGVHAWTLVPSPVIAGRFIQDETVAQADIVFSNTAIVTGTARRHTGAPVATGTVLAFRTEEPAYQATVDVAANGSYTMFGMPPFETTFRATLPFGAGQTPLTHDLVSTPTAGQLLVQDIVFPATGTVTGTLTDAASNVVAGRLVELLQVAGLNTRVFQRSVTTTTAGQFVFENVPAGTYRLEAVEPGTLFTVRVDVTVVANQTTVQNLSYLQTGTIEVEVRAGGETGPFVQGASVSTRLTGVEPNFIGRGQTDASGLVVAPDLRTGNYEVRVTSALVPGFVATVPATLVGNGSTLRVIVVLPSSATVNLTVRTSTGALAAGAAARITFGINRNATASTDALGRATFLNVYGDYTVSADVPGLANYGASVSGVVTVHGTPIPVELTLPPTGAISGRVTMPAGGAPPPGSYEVVVRTLTSNQRPDVNPDGTWSLPLAPAGRFLVWVIELDGAFFGSAEGVVAPGGAVVVDVVTDDAVPPVDLTTGTGQTFAVLSDGSIAEPGLDPDAEPFLPARYVSALSGPGGDDSREFHGGADVALNGRELRFVGPAISRLFYTRRVFVPEDDEFARYLEVFENPTSAPVTFTFTRFGHDLQLNGHIALQTSSGDGALTVADRWYVASGETAITSVFAGPGGVAPSAALSFFNLFVQTQWTITVPAGGRVALMFFEVARDEASGVDAALRLSDLPPEALVGLSNQDRSAIINFVVPPEP